MAIQNDQVWGLNRRRSLIVVYFPMIVLHKGNCTVKKYQGAKGDNPQPIDIMESLIHLGQFM